MAQFAANTSDKVYKIGKFLGINENPDGDTNLKMGEASEMQNWRITKDNHLQIRPGYGEVVSIGATPILGMWSGLINGVATTVCSCGGKLYKIDLSAKTKTEIGTVTGSYAHFFGFDKKLYLLTGSKYYVYDGTTLAEVEGYRPLVSISNVPTGGGTSLEQVNKLSGTRRAWFSPDGSATTFQLPEKGLASVDYVKKTADNAAVTFSADTANGTVTISPAPAKGTNSIEIGWTVSENYRSQVEGMRFSENYNGTQDTRVFLYGDGTNKTFYSGLDYDGKPRADYFPDMNEIAVDSANSPITALIKHYDSLLIFKADSAYTARYGSITLADGGVTAAFYTAPLNRSIGNAALGQAMLVQNNPFTLFGRSVYEWQLSSYAAKDERNAKSKSDRVIRTLSEFNLLDAVCFDDEYNTEYWVTQGGRAVIYNYTADAWYIYEGVPAVCFLSINGELYIGTSGGMIVRLSREFRNDNGTEIAARWQSGSMDFGMDYKRKHSSELWVVLKPESQARVTATVESNVSSNYDEKVVSSSLSTFSHASFAHWSFGTNRKPQTDRVKIKVKKFTFYRLILTSVSTSATATILGVDIRVRLVGNVK